MEAKGFTTYMLKCDNCQSVFDSKDALPERLLCPRCLIVFKAGIREVVDWMNENCLGCQSNTPSNQDKYLGFHKGSWQAKLKEWGVDKRHTVAIPPGPDFPNWKQRGIDE